MLDENDLERNYLKHTPTIVMCRTNTAQVKYVQKTALICELLQNSAEQI